MATLTVGPGEQYSSVAAAVAASSSGDTIDVDAGTYTNDFPTISHDLTLQAVGGTVYMVATVEPPNGKAIIDEGGSGVNVTINGFDLSGAQVPDNNGAGIRYEGGSLTLNNDNIHNNQDGLLSNHDPNGTITINSSTFTSNGAGDGESHNIYIGDIASFTLENSTSSSAVVGHEVKSRAQNNTITNNLIEDGPNGTSSYEIDFPNGGNNLVANNFIEKGPGAQNPIAITSGEEGNVYADSSLTVQGNTILNNDTGQTTYAVQNDTGVTANISGNNFFGWSVLALGPANLSSNTVSGATPTPAGLNGLADTSATSDPTTSGSGSNTAAADPAPASGPAPAGGTAATAADQADPTSQDASVPVTAATVGSSSTTPSFLASSGGETGTQSGSPAAAATTDTYQPATSLTAASSPSSDLTGSTAGTASAAISPASNGAANSSYPGGGVLTDANSGTQALLGVPSQGSAASSLLPT